MPNHKNDEGHWLSRLIVARNGGYTTTVVAIVSANSSPSEVLQRVAVKHFDACADVVADGDESGVRCV